VWVEFLFLGLVCSGGGLRLPLSHQVDFDATVKARCRVYVPGVVRGEFKLENGEVFLVEVYFSDPFDGSVVFHGRMGRDGRLTIPEASVDSLLRQAKSSLGSFSSEAAAAELDKGLVGLLVGVTLRPVKK
jgi:hypothetical protein